MINHAAVTQQKKEKKESLTEGAYHLDRPKREERREERKRC